MKKFFALMLVVAMLSVAGTAMAVTGSASPATVNMTVGKVATSTVTGVAANEGTLSYSIPSSTPAWITLKGNVVTFRPTTTANTSVVVTVTETYTTETDAGHSTATATADVTIRVNVSPVEQDEGEGGSSTADETTTVIERTAPKITGTRVLTVAILNATARKAASVLNFAQIVRAVAEAIADKALLNKIGLDQALIDFWTAPERAAQVEQLVKTAYNTAAKRTRLFPNLPAGADTTPRDNDQLEEVPGSTNDDADAGTKLAAATERLGSGRKALSAGGAVRPKKSGIYAFVHNFGKELFNLLIQGDKGMMGGSASAFSAAAVDSRDVVFLDSQGNPTTVIPGDENSKDIMPGFVTMVVVMEAGQVYEPVIFTTDSALEEKGITTESQDATVNVVDYSEKETVVVDANGNATVQEDAPTATVAKMTEALGIAPTRVPTSALTSATAIKSADAAADRKYATSHDMFIAATYPAVGALATGAFYAPVTFNKLSSDQTLAASADFEFYPDGLGDSAEKAYVAVFTMSGDVVTTPSSILGKEGYIAFVVENEVFKAAAKDTIMDRPTVTLALKPVSGSVKPTPGPDSGDQPAIEDSEFKKLQDAGYIDINKQLTSSAYTNGTPSLTLGTDGKYKATISLVFNVSRWTATVADNNGSLVAVGAASIADGKSSFKYTSNKTAELILDPSEISTGTHAVTLSVLPENAKTTATATLGNVIGTSTPSASNILGSSGGGCSAGSAVLALALLGSFILTRKK